MSEQITNLLQQMGQLSPDARAEVLHGVIGGLPRTEKAELADALRSALPPPSDRVRDSIWRLVVVGIVIVMVFSAIVLGVGVFIKVGDPTKQITKVENMLTVFTTTVAFLAGLLSPSPVGNKGG